MKSGLFIDTGVFIGGSVERDQNRLQAVEILRQAFQRELGALWMSDLVFAEVLNFFTRKRAQPSAVTTFLAATRGSSQQPGPVQPMLQVTGPIFTDALDAYVRHQPDRLSFTDCATLVLMEAHGIASLATFDGPLAAEARRRGIDVIGVPETP